MDRSDQFFHRGGSVAVISTPLQKFDKKKLKLVSSDVYLERTVIVRQGSSLSSNWLS